VTGGETPESPLVYKWQPRRRARSEDKRRSKYDAECRRFQRAWQARVESVRARIEGQRVAAEAALVVADLLRAQSARRARESAAKGKAREGPKERRDASRRHGQVVEELPVPVMSVSPEVKGKRDTTAYASAANAFPDGSPWGETTQEPPVPQREKKVERIVKVDGLKPQDFNAAGPMGPMGRQREVTVREETREVRMVMTAWGMRPATKEQVWQLEREERMLKMREKRRT